MDTQTLIQAEKQIGMTNQESLSVCDPQLLIYKYSINVQQVLKLSYTIKQTREYGKQYNSLKPYSTMLSRTAINSTNVCTSKIDRSISGITNLYKMYNKY